MGLPNKSSIAEAVHMWYILEAVFLRKGSLVLFGKFGQDWTENKKKIIIGQKVVKTPFLKNVASSIIIFQKYQLHNLF